MTRDQAIQLAKRLKTETPDMFVRPVFWRSSNTWRIVLSLGLFSELCDNEAEADDFVAFVLSTNWIDATAPTVEASNEITTIDETAA
jgi:hypothetical protein